MDEQSTQQEAAQASAAEQTAAESQSAEQTAQQQAEGAAEKQENTQSASSTGASVQENRQQEQKAEYKPVSRRSAQYRIEQLVKENQQLKAQAQPKEQQNDEDGQNAAEQPDINALVAREIERRLNPFLSESGKAADESELNELFTGSRASDRSRYEQPIRELWKLPQYKDVSAHDLYRIVSFDDAVKTATGKAIEEYKKAEKEARENSASGSSNTSNRTGTSSKNVMDMTDEEFRAHNDRIKAGA